MSLPRRTSSGGRPSKEEAEKLGEHILQEALQEFIAKGLDASRMDAIAASAHVSKRTLYARYKSKDELLCATMDYGIAKHIRPVSTLPANGPIRERLEAVAHKFLEASLTAEGRGIQTLLTWLANHRPDLQNKIRAKAVADVTGVMNQILKDGYANGEIAFSDFPAIAKIVFDLLFSLPNYEILRGMGPEYHGSESVSLDKELDFVMAALRTGVVFSTNGR